MLVRHVAWSLSFPRDQAFFPPFFAVLGPSRYVLYLLPIGTYLPRALYLLVLPLVVCPPLPPLPAVAAAQPASEPDTQVLHLLIPDPFAHWFLEYSLRASGLLQPAQSLMVAVRVSSRMAVCALARGVPYLLRTS